MSLDHVALWVSGRDAIAERAEAELGMHVIERTDRFTLVGGDPRLGKLTLFAADGEREAAPLVRVAFRAPGGRARDVDLGEGLLVRVVPAPDARAYELDHVALGVSDPQASARAWLDFGLAPAPPGPDGVVRVGVADAFLELHRSDRVGSGRELLNHLGVLVESVEAQLAAVKDRGIEVDEVIDAPNTLSLFVWGPDGVKLEYVEHKASFSLT
jgi:catechol 2,3-dioxygenase-like lactoylglutathione lyase family enzyme